MKTIVLRLAFDGTNYCGMQSQKNEPSVQEHLERAMQECCGYPVHVIAAGRTDAGVHARGMITHSRVHDQWHIPVEKIKFALHTRLPSDIRIMGAHIREGEDFHARFDAIAREYSYTIIRCQDPLTRLYSWQPRFAFSPELLMESAQIFRGQHDFTTFSKLNEDVKSYICNVELCEWKQLDNQSFRLRIKANRFVYGMVRSLVGSMMEAARGKRSIEDLSRALQACQRSKGSPLAPAQGLVFENAYYPNDYQLQFL